MLSNNIHILIAIYAFLCIAAVSYAENENSTTVATTVATTIATPKPEPKIDVLNSALCKKCICDKETKQLDCRNKQLTDGFNNDEWKILQNGDFMFETIRFENNSFTTIPQLLAYPVKSIYFAHNQIDTLPKGAFENLTELIRLDLSNNRITSKVLVPDVFKGPYSPSDYLPLPNLRSLNLGYNDLHNLDGDLFEHVPKLEELILCKNVFRVIDHLTETAISSLTSLKTLDISYLELHDLPDTLLHGPRDLETLILSGNLLDELTDNLELAVNLKELVLDENPMGDFEGENTFPVLPNLRYLSISYMPELTKISKGALSNLKNLTIFVAAYNPKLSYIDPYAFANPTSNPKNFDYPPLEKLYLNNNNLSVLPESLVGQWQKLTAIDLRFNPWDCDCTNDYLINTLMIEINATSQAHTKNVHCAAKIDGKSKLLLDLNAEKSLVCNDSGNGTNNLIWIGMLVGILIGIPITIGTLIVYKRGCFGIRHRNSGADRALYNRASFQEEDFHI